MAIERDFNFRAHPALHAVAADQHNQRATARNRVLQARQPAIARTQRCVVLEHFDAGRN